jgi:hypothetical protein
MSLRALSSAAVVAALAATALAAPALAQTTPAPAVAAYDNLATTILSVRDLEANLVRTILDGHHHAAKSLYERGDYAGAAAQMALFANEGDNAIGGVRKRLLEGGHHYNAEGEKKGEYEPGFVVVTREAKKQVLAASAALRQATTDVERKKAWDDFAAVVGQLHGH